MAHSPINTTADRTLQHLTETDLTVDYIRAQGLVQDSLRERYGDKMRDFTTAQFHSHELIARIGLASDQGTRYRNEDSAIAILGHLGKDDAPIPVILCGVADGIGGSADGDVASALAIEVLAEHVIHGLGKDHLRKRASKSYSTKIENLLMGAIRLAHDRIGAETNGGGSTLTCALIVDNFAYIAHVGDSRAYFLNASGTDIEQVTTDHRLVRRLQDAGIIAQKDVAHHVLRNVLYRSVGKPNQCQIDLVRRNLESGSRLLLCTDGIGDVLDRHEIYQIVHLADNPQQACEHLLEGAVAFKTHDDVTAVLVELEA
jgi:protein phosphatase